MMTLYFGLPKEVGGLGENRDARGQREQHHEQTAEREQDHVFDTHAPLVLFDTALTNRIAAQNNLLKFTPIQQMNDDRTAMAARPRGEWDSGRHGEEAPSTNNQAQRIPNARLQIDRPLPPQYPIVSDWRARRDGRQSKGCRRFALPPQSILRIGQHVPGGREGTKHP